MADTDQTVQVSLKELQAWRTAIALVRTQVVGASPRPEVTGTTRLPHITLDNVLVSIDAVIPPTQVTVEVTISGVPVGKEEDVRRALRGRLHNWDVVQQIKHYWGGGDGMLWADNLDVFSVQ